MSNDVPRKVRVLLLQENMFENRAKTMTCLINSVLPMTRVKTHVRCNDATQRCVCCCSRTMVYIVSTMTCITQ
jgi:hypothetical protein